MTHADGETRRRQWLWLSTTLGIGSPSCDALLDAFDSDITALYEADEEAYRQVRTRNGKSLRQEMIERLCQKGLEDADEVASRCREKHIGILTLDDPLFPARLKRIDERPFLLYYVGKLESLDERVCLAMVGTRNMSEYGRQHGYSLAFDLAKGGAIVVSGLARGVDGICHRGCLDAGGTTIAVLGCGLDIVYPPEHRDLLKEVVRHGIAFSEYPPGTAPVGRHFPQRNRIISGLSQGTVVIEAGTGSGALITAKIAGQQGRDLYALPGKAGEFNSVGPNGMIKEGAVMVTDAVEILREYECLYPHSINLAALKRYHVPLQDAGQWEKAASPSPAPEPVPITNAASAEDPKEQYERFAREAEEILKKKLPQWMAKSGNNQTPKEENIHRLPENLIPASRLMTEKKETVSPPSPEEDPFAIREEPIPIPDWDEKPEKPAAPKKQTTVGKAEKIEKTEKAPSSASRPSVPLPEQGSFAREIYDFLPENRNFEAGEIAKARGCPVPDVLTALTVLELRGLIVPAAGGRFTKA